MEKKFNFKCKLISIIHLKILDEKGLKNILKKKKVLIHTIIHTVGVSTLGKAPIRTEQYLN